MKKLSRYLLIVFILVLPQKILACLCEGNVLTIKQATKEYTLIFSGRVVRMDSVRKQGDSKQYTLVFKFVPNAIWRGAQSDTITVPFDRLSNCARHFETGKTYIIYTHPNHSPNICERAIEVGIDEETQRLDKRFKNH